jgi:hypothetical protein
MMFSLKTAGYDLFGARDRWAAGLAHSPRHQEMVKEDGAGKPEEKVVKIPRGHVALVERGSLGYISDDAMASRVSPFAPKTCSFR